MRMRFDWAIGSTVMGMPRCCSPKGADMRLLLALPLLAFALPAAAQTTPQAADIPYVTPLGQPPISTMVVEPRSEEHTSELQSLMRISYAVFCVKKKTEKKQMEQQNNKTTMPD